jgi:hypothetical protein
MKKIKFLWTVPVSFIEAVVIGVLCILNKYFEYAYSSVSSSAGIDQIENGISSVAKADAVYSFVKISFSVVIIMLILAIIANIVAFIIKNFSNKGEQK